MNIERELEIDLQSLLNEIEIKRDLFITDMDIRISELNKRIEEINGEIKK